MTLPLYATPFSSTPIKTLLLSLLWIYTASDHVNIGTMFNG